ncbi:MAG: hypothetical protein ACRDAM_01865, partial [Casimicrobium sp.]
QRAGGVSRSRLTAIGNHSPNSAYSRLSSTPNPSNGSEFSPAVSFVNKSQNYRIGAAAFRSTGGTARLPSTSAASPTATNAFAPSGAQDRRARSGTFFSGRRRDALRDDSIVLNVIAQFPALDRATRLSMPAFVQRSLLLRRPASSRYLPGVLFDAVPCFERYDDVSRYYEDVVAWHMALIETFANKERANLADESTREAVSVETLLADLVAEFPSVRAWIREALG